MFLHNNYYIITHLTNATEKESNQVVAYGLLIASIRFVHVFRLFVAIHCCKIEFFALWLCFSALSYVGKCLHVFSKINLFNGMSGKETVRMLPVRGNCVRQEDVSGGYTFF